MRKRFIPSKEQQKSAKVVVTLCVRLRRCEHEYRDLRRRLQQTVYSICVLLTLQLYCLSPSKLQKTHKTTLRDSEEQCYLLSFSSLKNHCAITRHFQLSFYPIELAFIKKPSAVIMFCGLLSLGKRGKETGIEKIEKLKKERNFGKIGEVERYQFSVFLHFYILFTGIPTTYIYTIIRTYIVIATGLIFFLHFHQ